jgi:branched-chain amino acid transport system permease protein
MYNVIFLDSIVYACMLSVLCVGLTLTYKITNIPNFAHTSFAVLGMYVALVITRVYDANPYISLPLAFVASGATSFLLYYGIIRILQKKKSSYLTLIIATLSFDFVMIGVLNIIADIIHGYRVTSRDFTLRSFDEVILGIPMVLIASIILLAGLLFGLYYLLYKTKFGISMRASIENVGLAETMGIDTNRIFGVSWFLSGGLGGIAGVLLALWFQGDPSLAALLLPSVFAGSIVGGFSSIYGAVIGGMMVGVTEIIGTGILASNIGVWIVAYKPVIAFLFIIVTLLVFPKGLASLKHNFRKKKNIHDNDTYRQKDAKKDNKEELSSS